MDDIISIEEFDENDLIINNICDNNNSDYFNNNSCLMLRNNSNILTRNTSNEQKDKESIYSNFLSNETNKINQIDELNNFSYLSNEDYQSNSENIEKNYIKILSQNENHFNSENNNNSNKNESYSKTQIKNISNNLTKEESDSKKQKYKKKEREKNKLNDSRKKNMGRKRKNDNTLKKHTSLAKDNAIYKIKVKYQKFIYTHLNNDLDNNMKLKKISGEIAKNGNKEFNLKLLKSSIKEFLMNPISSKYKNNSNTNETILRRIEHIEEINEFLSQTYVNGFYNYFLMKKDKYFKRFNFVNQFLYDNLKIDKELKNVWDKLIKKGLYEYFDEKDGRITINKI